MGFKDFIDLMKIKNSGALDGFDVFDKEKKWLFNEIFQWKKEQLENQVDVLTQDTETSKKTAEILEWTSFQKKFDELYGDSIEWQKKFEFFNRKISYVLKSYIDGMIPQYDDTIRVTIASGFQFVLMQKMTELGAKDSADFFANFSWKSGVGLKWIVGGLFKWLNNSSGFVTIGQRFQNFLYFLDEYHDDLWDLHDLQVGHLPAILLNDSRSGVWDSWTNIQWKPFDEIKDKIPLLSQLDVSTPTVNLKKIADDSAWSLNRKLLDVLSSEKNNGWVLVFASKFLQFRPKLKNFISKPLLLASKIFDNSFLGKQFLGWKSVVDYLQEKHHGKTMDLVLGIIGFRGGWKWLKRYLSPKKDGEHTESVDAGGDVEKTKKLESVDDYVDYTAWQIEKTESAKKYDAINVYDVDGVSLGKMQWHGVLAQKLMEFMQKQNSSEFENIMWSDFVSLMKKGVKEDWNIWKWPRKTDSWWESSPANWQKSHPDFITSFKKLMSNSVFQWYMDKFMRKTTKDYLVLARKNWITDPASAVYFVRLANWWPVKAMEFWNKSDKTLVGLHHITQQQRANDAQNPLEKIYNPLFADLQKTDFSKVDLNNIV